MASSGTLCRSALSVVCRLAARLLRFIQNTRAIEHTIQRNMDGITVFQLISMRSSPREPAISDMSTRCLFAKLRMRLSQIILARLEPKIGLNRGVMQIVWYIFAPLTATLTGERVGGAFEWRRKQLFIVKCIVSET